VTKPLVDEWRMASCLAAAHNDRPSLHRDESDGDPIRRSRAPSRRDGSALRELGLLRSTASCVVSCARQCRATPTRTALTARQ